MQQIVHCTMSNIQHNIRDLWRHTTAVASSEILWSTCKTFPDLSFSWPFQIVSFQAYKYTYCCLCPHQSCRHCKALNKQDMENVSKHHKMTNQIKSDQNYYQNYYAANLVGKIWRICSTLVWTRTCNAKLQYIFQSTHHYLVTCDISSAHIQHTDLSWTSLALRM